ncbi:DUF1214 domain-containing protein [uncultured Bartonella sp.]|uniref:DUF1214 domain-containing protein n=1 Tax=uncultured Bartonella sp. TaxID=104108 RepID=UPI002635EC04|nr:DUF1214 domain-containing protein [uncultured Bartonella sp.]
MFQRILLIILSLVIAIGGGAWSVNYALDTFDGFGRLTIGQWEAFPLAGTAEADAYARARAAKRGDISLGRTEGLIFQLWRDNNDHPLKSQCTYLLKGLLPETRLFTLYGVDHGLHPLWIDDKLPTELYSGNVVWDKDGTLNVVISPSAQPGNWLATTGNRQYGLILTLYDTPIATSTALQTLNMPVVEAVSSGVRDCG